MDSSGRLFSGRIPWVWIFVVTGAILYIPFIGGVHLFDWDEINFAEISREMISTGDYLNIQIDYRPFFEKPPFFFWLQVFSMKLFGVNEFAARFPNAIAGLLVLPLLYTLGKRWINERFGFFWALSYIGSILPLLYHKSGIIDPWFNLFIFGGIVMWIEGSKKESRVNRWYWISGVLSGLAILTKGPVGPLLIGLTVLLMRILSKDEKYLRTKAVIIFIVGNILVAGIWFGVNWAANGSGFILAFLKYQAQLLTESVAGHKGFPGYHFAVTLFGVFPASLFALGGLRKKTSEESTDAWNLRLMMIIILGVVLVLFSIVQSKIVHYSSLAYYPVTFLSAWTICSILDRKQKRNAWHLSVSVFVTLVVCISMWILPFLGKHIDWVSSNFSLDPFSKASMGAVVRWGLIDYTPAVWLLIILGAALWLWYQERREYALIKLFIGTGIFVNLALIFFIGKIESYSQRAAVEFCQSKAGQPVEITTLGFKSYLPYFYAKKPVPDSLNTTEGRLHYYILREDKRKRLKEWPQLQILYEKNGFIFLEEK